MFGLLELFQRRSYASRIHHARMTTDDAFIDALTPPVMREGLARVERQRREKQAREDAARAALEKGHAASVGKLLAKLSELERAWEAGSVTATVHRMRVDTARLAHDRQIRDMLQTAERVYGVTAVRNAKRDLDL